MWTYRDVFRAWWLQERQPEGARSFQLDGRMFQERGRITCASNNAIVAETLRRRSGEIHCILLNADATGDRYFTNQQAFLRDYLQRVEEQTCILLPFTALEAAGIDRTTIVPIEIRADRQERITRQHPNFKLDDVSWRAETRNWRGERARNGTVRGQPQLLIREQSNIMRWDSSLRIQRLEETTDAERYRLMHRRSGPVSFEFRGRTFRRLSTTEWRHWLGDSVFRARAHNATRTFISSFDYNEPVPLYYLAELPWNERHVNSVVDAERALAPAIVKAAWEQGREVKRQGDIFAIPTKLTLRDVRKRAGSSKALEAHGVYGTDHQVTAAYVTPAGATYVKGTMRHRPEGRPPDHIELELGNAWHLVVPNAVPRRRAGAMVRG